MQNISRSPNPWHSSWKIQEEHGSFHQDIMDFEDAYKDSITKTWWGTTFGDLFEKVICSTLATLENYSFLNLFEWFLTLFVYLPYKCCFLSHRMNKNVKLSSFFHNRYEIFLGWVHKIKVCVECSRFSIGFRHKQLKRNTWKPGTNTVLHSVTDDLNFSSDDSD